MRKAAVPPLQGRPVAAVRAGGAAAATLAAAQRCLAEGHWLRALRHAEAGDWMRSDVDSRRLLAVAYLLNRDFAHAWHWYQKVGPS